MRGSARAAMPSGNRARRYAEREYGEFDEIEAEPYPSLGGPD